MIPYIVFATVFAVSRLTFCLNLTDLTMLLMPYSYVQIGGIIGYARTWAYLFKIQV